MASESRLRRVSAVGTVWAGDAVGCAESCWLRSAGQTPWCRAALPYRGTLLMQEFY